MWPSGAPAGVPVTITVTAATGESGQGGGGSTGGVISAPPQKLTRYEAMWTDCDPSLWEYVVV